MKGIKNAIAAVKEYLNEDFPFYSDALLSAFVRVNPVFTRPKYADFFWHCGSTIPGWLPNILVESAIAESIGSKTLLTYWKIVKDNEQAENGLLRHARDEAAHAHVFLRLVDLAFPDFVPFEKRHEIDSSLHKIPGNIEKEERRLPEMMLINYLTRINMAELRTLINLHLLAPMFYALTPDENKEAVSRLLNSLQRDELHHIAYTAELLEIFGRDSGGSLLNVIYKENLYKFELYSTQGLEEAIRAHGGNEFFDLLQVDELCRGGDGNRPPAEQRSSPGSSWSIYWPSIPVDSRPLRPDVSNSPEDQSRVSGSDSITPTHRATPAPL